MDDEITNAEAPKVVTGRLSELPEDEFCRVVKELFLSDSGHSSEWRKACKEDFDFVAGHQWPQEAAKTLNDQQRVPITFNMTLSVIKSVAGLEINSRHDTIFYPRDASEGDVVANEMLSGCSRWMSQNCDAEDHQSEAFQHTLICGMGFTESRMDFEEEPDGKYIEEIVDPAEMYWDKAARGKNLYDTKRRWRSRKMTLGEARDFVERIGIMDKRGNPQKFDDEDLDASWAVGSDMPGAPKPVEERALRLENSGQWDPKKEVHIVQLQWWEREKYTRVADPFSGQIVEPDEEGLAELQRHVDEYNAMNGGQIQLETATQYRKVYKQAFIGGKVLMRGDCPRKDGFTLNCITGQLDKNKGVWFGLVRLLREPQMMANKWLSQTQHIINTTAKGGILAERGAFRDIREAQGNYARPDAITVVENGAIKDGRIMQKPGAGVAGPYMQLLEYAVDSIWRVTGMNQEILGMRDTNQPGVLEQQRKQAAMTILATLFDSLRGYRKQIGRTRLFFIQNYLSDGRIIRILGEKGPQAVRLMKERTLGQYDVEVSDAPTSPNTKEQTFGMLMQLLPYFSKEGMSPGTILIFLEYSPLPREVVEQLKKEMERQQQPTPEGEMQKQIAVKGAVAKIGRDEAAAAKDFAAAEKTRAEAGVHQSAEALNQARTMATGAKMIQGLQKHAQGMQDVSIQDQDTGYLPPQAPQLPSGPMRDPNAVPIEDLLSQLQPEQPAPNGVA